MFQAMLLNHKQAMRHTRICLAAKIGQEICHLYCLCIFQILAMARINHLALANVHAIKYNIVFVRDSFVQITYIPCATIAATKLFTSNQSEPVCPIRPLETHTTHAHMTHHNLAYGHWQTCLFDRSIFESASNATV